MKKGLLLINLGTPNSPRVADVRVFLQEFLTDKRVIDIPSIIRYCLVYGIISPIRAPKSAHAYQAIWMDQGSPLLYFSQNLRTKLQDKLSTHCTVALGMRYGQPSVQTALNDLKECDEITVLPLYPQYSSATTGSSIEHLFDLLSAQEVLPSLRIIGEFFQHPAYIKAQAQRIKDNLGTSEYLLFSYHGIPERQVKKSGCTRVCLDRCPPISATNKHCYKAQCQQTSELLAQELQLNNTQYSSSFQSRIGKTPWIKPYTDEVIQELAAKGIKRLAVVCPSFVSDCLETIEEIGIRAKQQWIGLGGQEFNLIPSMNDDMTWVQAVISLTSIDLL